MSFTCSSSSAMTYHKAMAEYEALAKFHNVLSQEHAATALTHEKYAQ